jgi:hypothetical protein
MNKCRYYNDAQTACTLQIDDLAAIAVTKDGVLTPCNDWGYGLDSKNSLWRYFDKNLLEKYPEIRGAIFYATRTYKNQNENAGYSILTREVDDKFKNFIKRIDQKFELAFHGTTHGKYLNKDNYGFKSNYLQEFEYIDLADIPILKDEITRVEDFFEVKFNGGKYCGYLKNEFANKIIEELGFKWWASSCEMINKKHLRNGHSYFGIKRQVLDLPTNVSGNLFNIGLKRNSRNNLLLGIAKTLFRQFRHSKKEQYLQYLYEKGHILSIQEHFQNQRTDGKRQTPNIYDDIESLNHIYRLLRGTDTWHATCSEIAHYMESYDNTEIIQQGENTFLLKYNGRWETPFLSLKSDNRFLLHLDAGEKLQGLYKQGNWIFNNIKEGMYKII